MNKSNQKIAIFPGSFHPFHLGHQSIIERAQILFDQIYIIITKNHHKKHNPNLIINQRKIAKFYADSPKIKVIINETQLTAKLAHELNASFIIRGIRNEADARYEIDASWVNHTLNHQLTTILIPTLAKNHHVSSTLIREVASYGVKLKHHPKEQ